MPDYALNAFFTHEKAQAYVQMEQVHALTFVIEIKNPVMGKDNFVNYHRYDQQFPSAKRVPINNWMRYQLDSITHPDRISQEYSIYLNKESISVGFHHPQRIHGDFRPFLRGLIENLDLSIITEAGIDLGQVLKITPTGHVNVKTGIPEIDNHPEPFIAYDDQTGQELFHNDMSEPSNGVEFPIPRAVALAKLPENLQTMNKEFQGQLSQLHSSLQQNMSQMQQTISQIRQDHMGNISALSLLTKSSDLILQNSLQTRQQISLLSQNITKLTDVLVSVVSPQQLSKPTATATATLDENIYT